MVKTRKQPKLILDQTILYKEKIICLKQSWLVVAQLFVAGPINVPVV
jgi:hypothetical protein